MKNHSQVSCIPGLGFSADIFKHTAFYSPHCQLLNFPYMLHANLETLSDHFAEQLADQSTIIAWSFGGLPAIKIAAEHPHKVKQLVLITSTPKFTEDRAWPGIGRKQAHDFIKHAEYDLDALYQYFISLVNFPKKKPKHKETLLACSALNTLNTQLVDHLKILFKADLRTEYSQLKQPVLHIIGQRDGIIRQDEAALKELNPAIKTHTISNAGHSVMVTHAEEVAEIIQSHCMQGEKLPQDTYCLNP